MQNIIIGLVALIACYFGLQYLWDKRFRPRQIKNSIPTRTWTRLVTDSFKVVFVDDKSGYARMPAKLQKIITPKTSYLVMLALTIASFMLADKPTLGIIVLIALIILVAGRARTILQERDAILTRMFQVAHSEFKYPRGSELNPWKFINVKQWENNFPGKTLITFPAHFRSDQPKSREDFEKHFNGTVGENNSWSYEWNGAKGIVEAKPVPPLPTMVKYPGSSEHKWNEIPLGVGIDGEILWDVSFAPHILVCGTTGGGKLGWVNTQVRTPFGFSTIGEIRVGDKIFDERGRLSTVTAAHKILIGENTYEVTFSDGEKMLVSGDHLWYTNTRSSRASDWRQRNLEEKRARKERLPLNIIEKLKKELETTTPFDVISIPEMARLAHVHETTKYLHTIAKIIGPAEIHQNKVTYKYAGQDVTQTQTVNVYDARELKTSALKMANTLMKRRNIMYTPQGLARIQEWADTLHQDDHYVSLVDIAEILDVPSKSIAPIISPILRKADTARYEMRETVSVMKSGKERRSVRKTSVVAATEIAPILYERASKKMESWSFIDDDYIRVIESKIPENGTLDRYEFAELTHVDPRLLKQFFEQLSIKSKGTISKEVTLRVNEKEVTRDGTAITKYPKALFLQQLIERGSALSYDQRHKLIKGSVKTTLEIMETLHHTDGALNHSLPRIKPLEFPEADLLIDPYTLGAWLGDEYSHSGAICGIDHEIFEKVTEIYPDATFRLDPRKENQDYRIVSFNGLKEHLKALNILKYKTADGDTKRIPFEYQNASVAQRRALLAGLMDTDGTVEPDGQVSFTTVIPQLRDDVLLLVRSLGYLPRVHSRVTTNTVTGLQGRESYTIEFSADPEDKIFGLSRKQEKHEERYTGGNRANVRYIVDVKQVESVPMRCISVDSPSRLFLAGEALIPTHNSVLQRNILFHCIQHSDKWIFLGVDVKRVELPVYAKYDQVVAGIAADVTDGLEVIRFGEEEMMKRYDQMQQLGVNHFLKLPNPPKAIMIMVDETYSFLATSGVKSDEGKQIDEEKAEATILLGNIARLGRAAGVHLVIATQRPDAKVIPGELKQNLAARYATGRMDSTASSMVLDTTSATETPDVKGRGIISFFGQEAQIQGYFAEEDWIDEWLAAQNGSAPKTTDSEGIDLSDFNANDFPSMAQDMVADFGEDGAGSVEPPESFNNPMPKMPSTVDLFKELEDPDDEFGTPFTPVEPERTGPILKHGAGAKTITRIEDEWDSDMEAIFDIIPNQADLHSGKAPSVNQNRHAMPQENTTVRQAPAQPQPPRATMTPQPPREAPRQAGVQSPPNTRPDPQRAPQAPQTASSPASPVRPAPRGQRLPQPPQGQRPPTPSARPPLQRPPSAPPQRPVGQSGMPPRPTPPVQKS